jgi:predicted MFS family arabinose efflux permease
VELVLFGWLALELTNSPWMVALLGFIRAAPHLFGMFTSVITDRFRRRDLLIALQVIIISVISVLAALSWIGSLKYWHLAAASLIHGSCWTLDWSTRRALYPDLVGKERIIDAMLLDNVFLNISRCLGPLVGGILINYSGARGTFLLNGFLVCSDLVFLLRLRTPSRAPSSPTGPRDAYRRMLEGVEYVRRRPRIRGVLLITLFMNMWVFPFLTLVPVFVRDILGRGPLSLGVMTSAFGVGALLGLLAIRWSRRYWGDALILAVGSLICAAGFASFSFSGSFELSLAFIVIAGIGTAGFSIMQSGIILSDSSSEMRGRSMAAAVLAIGGAPLGGLQSIGLVIAFGAPITVASMSLVGFAAIAAVALYLPGFRGSER